MADRSLRMKTAFTVLGAARVAAFAAALTILPLLLAACSGGGGGGGSSQSTPPPTGQNYTDPVVYSGGANASLQSAAEITAVTHAQLPLNGATLNYTATAGHLTARTLGTGAERASFFYVAYTLDNAPAATRPVTFFYNGGPGSASVWLHLGSFGPKRLVTGFPATTAATPFPLVDNAESLLDVSDLVFVDAIGSGYSQAIAPNTNSTFWGVDVDAAAFRDFVMRYVIVNNRAASPKFLYGESYGGPRTGILAHLLETAGVHLHGVVLQSPAMNYSSNCGIVDGVAICSSYLPSYAASGAWYNRANPSPAPAAIPAYMVDMRTFSTTQYDPAVRSLLGNGVAPAPALLTQLVNTTGLSLSNWQTNLNFPPGQFQSALMPGTQIGRYDSRVSAPSGSALAQNGDPSSTFISPSFGSNIMGYLAALGYTTPSGYVMSSNAINSWNFTHDGRQVPDTIPDLAAAIAINPALKVLAVNGYHDLATPFYITEQDLARLGNNPNVRIRNYMGGHMTYLDDGSRVLQKADLVQFYQNALAP